MSIIDTVARIITMPAEARTKFIDFISKDNHLEDDELDGFFNDILADIDGLDVNLIRNNLPIEQVKLFAETLRVTFSAIDPRPTCYILELVTKVLQPLITTVNTLTIACKKEDNVQS